MLHTTLVGIDEEVAFGSSNLDVRSFELELELTLLVPGQGFARRVAGVEDVHHGRSALLASDARRSWPVSVADDVARLASAIV